MTQRQFRRQHGARLALLREPSSAPLNGIESIEVLSTDQRTLRVTFVRTVAANITADCCRIDGGVRITGIRIDPATFQRSGRNLSFKVVQAGDFSWYDFVLQHPAAPEDVPDDIDPVLASVRFSFKAQCPSDFDCADDTTCPALPLPEPALDYLAKDHASFRRLMLDRIVSLVPAFDDGHPASFGMALVELFAHVGDQLSYQQDAVATEAYLGTARRRVSLRRHARLLDYPVHEGCNSRVWVSFDIDAAADGHIVPAHTPLLSRGAGAQAHTRALSVAAFDALSQGQAVVFETMHALVLRAGHGRIAIHTHGDPAYCLPRGATQAALVVAPAMDLEPGLVLIFEEVRSPTSGQEADADTQRRHAVRLTAVQADTDPLDNTALLLVRWADEDALPFALCVAAEFPAAGGTVVRDIAVARGNVVLADHGQTRHWQPLLPPEVPTAGAWRPRLPDTGIAHAQTFQPQQALGQSAAAAVRQDPQQAMPAGLQLVADDALQFGDQPQPGALTWQPQVDLLGSDRFTQDFVAETDSDGSVLLRFGDNRYGAAPDAGARLLARWRTGGGTAGNVGADSIARIVSDDTVLTGQLKAIRNPLPATGGTDPETAARIRALAPEAFRTQQRAVTEEDYARAAERHPQVQRAVARLRWTGSWFTVLVSVDRRGGLPVDEAFAQTLLAHLDRFRLTGHDLRIGAPVAVALDVWMRVCVLPGHFAAQVQVQLLQRLDTGTGTGPGNIAGGAGPDGRADGLAFFHPDHFSFGQGLALSALVAAAQGVAGVGLVEVTRFQRWGRPAAGELGKGFLPAAQLEVLRLDNDPNFPENGRLRLFMQGGL